MKHLEKAFLAEDVQHSVLLLPDPISLVPQAGRRISLAHILHWHLRQPCEGHMHYSGDAISLDLQLATH